ncbi:MAG: SAM-dependent methyltransferase, partial [Gammaproteobacteria bacterium]
MQEATDPPAPRILLAIGLVSAAALAYEVLLVRLFSIIQWHQFAFMIISVALLGYGAGGSFLSLWATRLDKRFGPAFVIQAALFGASTIPCFLAAQALRFNPLEALWDPGHVFRLCAIYLLLCLPFAFAACCIGLALGHYRERLHYVYACDLVGASGGAMGVMGLLYLVFPGTALKAVALLGLAAALIACRGLGSRRWGTPALVFAIGGVLVLPEGWVRPEPLPYKGLPQALEILGTRVIAERSSPLGILQVIESPQVPFRYAPGLSLNAPAEPPEQLGLFQDADGMSAITRYRGDPATLAYLDYLPSALPYHLIEHPAVLVLGAGGGAGVLQAVYHRARGIDAVELNPQIIALLREDFREYTGGILDLPEVRVHGADARGFVAGASERFDLIELSLLDAGGASGAGLQASNANYLYTVEALAAYLRRLTPGGILAITRSVTLPPRDGLKLFAMAVSALEAEGEREPARRLAWIRGFKTHTLLLRNGAFEAED